MEQSGGMCVYVCIVPGGTRAMKRRRQDRLAIVTGGDDLRSFACELAKRFMVFFTAR